MKKELKNTEMVAKTMEGFIRKLEIEGMSKYASELRSIVAMSRKRKEAISALSNMTITLLEHLIKFIAIPESTDRNKWRGEIRGYLNRFNIRNKSPKDQPWLSLEYILADINDVLRSSDFLIDMKDLLKDYPDKRIKEILSLLKSHKTLKSLGVKLLFDSDNNLGISANGQVL